MGDRLLSADTRLTAEHILALYQLMTSEDVIGAAALQGTNPTIDLTTIFDMALRETEKAPRTDPSTAAAIEEISRLTGQLTKARVRIAELETYLDASEERAGANSAILKARTEEMNKAHHKIERAKRVQRMYAEMAEENNDKLEDITERLDSDDDLDTVEMMAEFGGAVASNIRLALADLKPMSMEEVSKLEEYDTVWYEDPDDKLFSRMIRIKQVSISGDVIAVVGHDHHDHHDLYVECGTNYLWRVIPHD